MLRKILIVLLIILSIALCGRIKTYASSECYYGYVYSENDVDLNNIRINIVELNNEEDVNKSRHVYTNLDGEFVFGHENSNFKIDVDLSSLPLGYGIEQKSVFVSPENNNEIILFVYEIDSVKAELKNGNIDVSFKSSDGISLFVDYKADIEYDVSINTIIDIYNLVSIPYTIIINTQQNSYYINDYIDVSDYSFLEKMNVLEEIEMLHFDVNNIETQNRSVLTQYQYTNGTSYCYLNRFVLFYDADQNSRTYLTTNELIAIGQKFLDVEAYFSNLDFSLPSTTNNQLHIYIVFGGDGCLVEGEYLPSTKSIYLNISYANLQNHDFKYEIIAHEYFHAVQDCYGDINDYFDESTAAYASFMFLKDNSLFDSNSQNYYKDLYNHFTSNSELLCNEKYDKYSAFIFYYYLGVEYDDGNLLSKLRSFIIQYGSQQSFTTIEMFNGIIYTINPYLNFDDVFNDFIAVCYPGIRIDSSISWLSNYASNGYEQYEVENHDNIVLDTSYYGLKQLQSYGYYIMPIIASNNTYGQINISFEDIGSDINIKVVSKKKNLSYSYNNLVTGSDGSKNLNINDFCSYECIYNQNVTIVAYVILTNTGSTAESVTISYSTYYKPYNNVHYYIKNVVSNKYISTSAYNNVFQYQKDSDYYQKLAFVYVTTNVYQVKFDSFNDNYLSAYSLNSVSNAISNLNYNSYYNELLFVEINNEYYTIRLFYDTNYFLNVNGNYNGSEMSNLITDNGNIYFNNGNNINYGKWRLYYS